MNAQTLEERQEGLKVSDNAPLMALKDDAVLLTMANEYLCDIPFLVRIGEDIEKNIEPIAAFIEDLKSQFIGQPVEKIDLTHELQDMVHFARSLQDDKNIQYDRCVKGELGKELNEKVQFLMDKIDNIKNRINGTTLSYTKAESFKSAFGRLKVIMSGLLIAYSFFLKIIGFSILLCIIVMPYLYITMEKEGSLHSKIEENRAAIISLKADLPIIQEQLDTLLQHIVEIKKNNYNRQTEIEETDLKLRAYNFTEEQDKIEVQINLKQNELKENLRQLEKLKKRSFLRRLFRS